MQPRSFQDRGTIGLIVTGLASWFVALITFLNDSNSIGAGVCLIAAAIAFGALPRETPPPG